MVDMIRVNKELKIKTTPLQRFKVNFEKHFVSCARNNRLWEAFTEFKQQTENDEIFANYVKSPEIKKEINKVILDSFCKIDTSKTKYKYYNAISKLKKRFQNNFELFSNSYIDDYKSPFMDNIMQEIIDRDISFLNKNDRELFFTLFSILQNPDFKSQDDKFKAFEELNKNVLPNNSNKGKFSSSKVADKFRNLNELCKKISNCQSFIISSTALNTKSLSFEQALDKFRLDLKKRYIPTFEVANMYQRSLGIKPLDIADFINKQEELFVAEFMRQNPNVNINYSKPDLNKVYPFIKFPIINLPKPNGVKHVKKSAISENLKRAHNSLKDLTKLSKKIISNTGELGRKQINNAKNAITAKNVGKNISKNTPKNISKDIIKSFENKNF